METRLHFRIVSSPKTVIFEKHPYRCKSKQSGNHNNNTTTRQHDNTTQRHNNTEPTPALFPTLKMELTETRSRIQDVLFDTNRGLPYVHSRQIHGFLDRVETKFNILINDPHWDTAKMFVSKYPDLNIDKNIFLELLDDLLHLDFVKYVHDKSDTRSFEVPSSLGSPLAIPGKSDNLFSDYEFERLNREIDDNIERLARGARESRVPMGLQQGLQPPLHSTSTSSSSSMRTNPNFNDKAKKEVKEVHLARLAMTGIHKFSSSLPMVNMILLVILIVLLLGQYVSLERHVYPYIRSFFLYETSEDIYWWQRWSFAERHIWTLLEYIQDKTQD